VSKKTIEVIASHIYSANEQQLTATRLLLALETPIASFVPQIYITNPLKRD